MFNIINNETIYTTCDVINNRSVVTCCFDEVYRRNEGEVLFWISLQRQVDRRVPPPPSMGTLFKGIQKERWKRNNEKCDAFTVAVTRVNIPSIAYFSMRAKFKRTKMYSFFCTVSPAANLMEPVDGRIPTSYSIQKQIFASRK